MAIFDFLSHSHKGLRNIDSTLSTDFFKDHVVPVSQLLGLSALHLTLSLEVDLCPYQHLDSLLVSAQVDLPNPLVHVLKTLTFADLVDKNYGLRSFEISLSYVAKPLLPCCIPNLHFDLCRVNIDGLQFEVYSNGCYIAVLKSIFTKPSQEVSLPHTTVAYYDHLGQKLLFFRRF